MMTGNNRISLPELVMIQVGCKDEQELGKLDKWQKRYVAEQLANIDPARPALPEWNRLLKLLLGFPPESSCKAARTMLLNGLRAG